MYFDPLLKSRNIVEAALPAEDEKDATQVPVTVAPLVGHAGQMGVPLLTVLAHHLAVVVGVLLEEPLCIVVPIDVDLGEGVVGGGLDAALVHARLQPGHDELEAVALFHLLHQLVRVELAAHHQDQVLATTKGELSTKQQYPSSLDK